MAAPLLFSIFFLRCISGFNQLLSDCNQRTNCCGNKARFFNWHNLFVRDFALCPSHCALSLFVYAVLLLLLHLNLSARYTLVCHCCYLPALFSMSPSQSLRERFLAEAKATPECAYALPLAQATHACVARLPVGWRSMRRKCICAACEIKAPPFTAFMCTLPPWQRLLICCMPHCSHICVFACFVYVCCIHSATFPLLLCCLSPLP